jgi:hypothetical protein
MDDIHGKPLDPIWMAEFRGFFFGDGYVGITTNGVGRRTKGKNYTGCIQITLRDDDIAILEEFQSRLGGSIWRERRGRRVRFDELECEAKPYAAWRIRSRTELLRVLDILDGGFMPSQKRGHVRLLREFLGTCGRIKPGKQTQEEEKEVQRIFARRAELHRQMLEAHQYTNKETFTA